MTRVLPEHLEGFLDERDQLLNRLSPEKLIEIFEAGESRLLVDKGLALVAAGSGVPVSRLASSLSLLFPILLVCAVGLAVFAGWQWAILAVLGAIVSFRASRHFTKEDVGRIAVTEPRLLVALMGKGVVWFEMADR